MPPLGRVQFHEADTGHVEEVLQVDPVPVVRVLHLGVFDWDSGIEVKGSGWLIVAGIPKPTLAPGCCRPVRRVCHRWCHSIRIRRLCWPHAGSRLSASRGLGFGRRGLKPDVFDWAALMPLQTLYSTRFLLILVILRLNRPFPEQPKGTPNMEALAPSERILLGTQTLDHLHQVRCTLAIILGAIDLPLQNAPAILLLLLIFAFPVDFRFQLPRIRKSDVPTSVSRLTGYEAGSGVADGFPAFEDLSNPRGSQTGPVSANS